MFGFGRKKEEIDFAKEFANTEDQVSLTKRKSTTEETVPEWDLRGTLMLRRETFDKFEVVFYKEPIMNAGGVIYKTLTVEAGYEVRSQDQRFIKSFIEWRRKSRFNEMMLEYVPLHLFIFGNAFLELLVDKKSKEIVDIIVVDPKTMDFQRDTVTKKVLFENNGEVTGWIQKPWSDEQNWKEFSRKEMYHITLNQITKGQMGVGLIEPVYEDISLKENIEQAKSEIAYLMANPIPLVRFGSELHPPTTSMKKNAERLAQDLRTKDTLDASFPYYFEVGWFKPDTLSDITDEVMYATKLQASVMGIPLAFLMQSTEKESKSGIEQLYDFFSFRFAGFQKALHIEELIRYIWKLNGWDVPEDFHVVYGDITEKSMKEKTMRIFRLGKAGLLDNKDPILVNYLRKEVGLPPLSDDRIKELTTKTQSQLMEEDFDGGEDYE